MLGPESKSDKRKQSLYFPEEMLEEIKEEASTKSTILSEISQNGLSGVIFTNFNDKFPMLNRWKKFMLGPESRSEPPFMSLG